jgi:hypothetical protein
MMVRFIDAHQDTYGVEPICDVLPIAPSLYHERRARQRDPERRPPRVRRDERLGRQIQRAWHEEHEVYGARKVWKHLRREGEPVARCTVERLMRQLGLHGVELTRFRGHPIVGAERKVHDAEEPSAISAGVPAADRRVGP